MSKKRILITLTIVLIFSVSIIVSFLYYNDKYKIIFETGTEEMILTQYIKKNNKVIEPKQPVKEGYVFVEWQLEGKKYNFDTKVDENMNLTAKWIKEKYITVNYVTNSTYEIESIKILKGSKINNLPEAYKDGYKFIGWYIDGKKYDGEEINDEVTLYAEYKSISINPDYKVGDKVLIIDNYSSSAYSINSYYSEAIGWDRKIMYIIEDSNYPYAVGNEEGITGFFKSNSISIIEGGN